MFFWQKSASSEGRRHKHLRIKSPPGDTVRARAFPQNFAADGQPLTGVRCEVRCANGQPLTDGVGDGEWLLQALPAALAAIAAAVPRGPVFVHCQQGRSCAGAIATEHLLSTHAAWSLRDALGFLVALGFLNYGFK